MSAFRVSVALDRQVFMTQRRGGVSRYFSEIVRQTRLHPEWGVDVHLPRLTYNLHAHELRSLRSMPWPALPESGLAGRVGRRALRELASLPPTGWRRHDLIHHTNFDARVLQRTRDARHVVTVYDLIPELYPHYFDESGSATASAKIPYLKAASLVLVISESTRDDLSRILGPMVSSPVVVTPLAAAEAFSVSGPTLQWPKPYFLYVGTRAGYKNFDLLVASLSAIRGTAEETDLLCVGGGSFTGAEKRHLEMLGLARSAHQVDATDSELPSIYRGALALVFPSVYEGFGLPTLEAMGSGCPALLSRTPALEEVGDDAALYFDPEDEEDLAKLLIRVIGDEQLRGTLKSAGLQRAKDFSWKRTVESISSAYRLAL